MLDEMHSGKRDQTPPEEKECVVAVGVVEGAMWMILLNSYIWLMRCTPENVTKHH